MRHSVERIEKVGFELYYMAKAQRERPPSLELLMTSRDRRPPCGVHYNRLGHFDWARTEARVFRLLRLVVKLKEEQGG